MTLRNFHKIKAQIDKAERICIIPHVNPDGDAIGSSLALYLLLKEKGKDVNVVSANKFPDFLAWMKGSEEIIIRSKGAKKANAVIDAADLIFMLDFNAKSRMELLENKVVESKATKILIDHHPEPEDFADIVVSQVTAGSTAEILFSLLNRLNGRKPLSSHIAEAVYTGIMTDTGSFSYSVTPEAHRITAKLLKEGLDARRIHNLVYDTFSENRMRLLGYSLSEKLFVNKENQSAYIALSFDDLKRYNYQIGDTEGLVNYALAIEGITKAAIFLEKKDHVKVSLRSKGDVVVNTVAQQYFHGGGHKNAAGGTYYGKLDAAIKLFISIK